MSRLSATAAAIRTSSEQVYRALQLRALRSICLTVFVQIAFLLLVVRSDSPGHTVVRLGICGVTLLLYFLMNEQSVRPLALVLAVSVLLSPVIRGWYVDEADVVMWMIIYGSHRCLPLLTVIMRGRAACLVTSALSAVSPFLVVTAKRYLAGKLASVGVVDILCGAHLTAFEQHVIFTDVYFLAMATAVAIFNERSVRVAVDLLSEALAAKQQFITNMVT